MPLRLLPSTALAVTMTVVAGCSALNYHEIPGPSWTSGAAMDPTHGRPKVVVVVIDGLRRDVFDTYTAGLKADDFDPEWPSGLARLVREGFRLGTSNLAEAPSPSYGMGAAATIATGQFPGGHGIPGSTWFEAGPNGTLRRFDFESPEDASRIYFGLDFELPRDGLSERPLLSHMLKTPTVYERLSPTHRSVAVFQPFGAGARWRIPSRAGPAVTAIMRDRRAAAVVPVFDRGARNAAIAVFLEDDLPDLVSVFFSGVALDSCFQINAVCDGTVGDLAALQRAGLRQVDGYLDKMFRKLLAAHPEVADRLTVILVSTGGTVDRTRNAAPDSEHVLSEGATFERLAAGLGDDPCASQLRMAAAAGELVVAPDGSSAQIYARRAPLGRQSARRAVLRCLAAAVEAAVDSKESPWLAGAAWRRPDTLDEGRHRAVDYEVRLVEDFARALSAQRRGRAASKLRAGIDDGRSTRAGDAVLYARAPWVFVDARRGRDVPYAVQGGLEDEAMRIPFVIASRRLDEVAVAALRSTPVELADVAPTILSILRAPEAAFQGLPRPPVVRWAANDEHPRLELYRADRQIGASRLPEDGPRLVWREADGEVIYGAVEPVSVDEPEILELRFADARWRWDIAESGFAPDAPCVFEEDATWRRWSCRAPWPPQVDGPAAVLAVGRTPAIGDEDETSRDDRLASVFIADTTPRFGESGPVVECAEPERIRVRHGAVDDLGLASVDIVVIDAVDAGAVARSPGSARATARLGRLAPTPACHDTGFGLNPECRYRAVAERTTPIWDIPFRAIQLEHHASAQDYLANGRVDGDHLARVFAERAPADAALPDEAYLAIRVCNVVGRCAERPLISDRDYWERLEQGCP